MKTQIKNFYVSFGQEHTHNINGRTYDPDSIALIQASEYKEARTIAFEIFGQKFCMIYDELPDMSFYPRGVIEI